MIPLYRANPNDETEHGVCPHCSAALSIPYTGLVDTLPKLRSLLDGTLNTEPCHGCGVSITVQEPVVVNMESHGIEELCYLPLSYLERGFFPPEILADPEDAGRVFYSLNELARQVRARILIRKLRIPENWQAGGKNAF